MILYSCPTCGAKLEAEEHCAGQKHPCPQCEQRLQVPPSRNKTVLGKPLDKDNKTVLGKPLHDPVVLELADEDDGYRVSRRRRRYSPFECPYCGSREKPELKKETATVGWIMFAVLLLFFFPLCWLGIFMRETWEACWECGRKVHKVEDVTLNF